jgi:exoribonuclease R
VILLYYYNLNRKKLRYNVKEIDIFKGLIDNRNRTVYTIDSEDTLDFDDAFSIQGTNSISIYIINVAYYINKYDLYDFY